MQEEILNPKNVSATPATNPIKGEAEMPKDVTRSFSSYMKENTNPLATPKSPQISPFDLAQGKSLAAGPTFHTLQEQAKTAHSTLGDVANQLNTPKLKLKQSTKYLLKNKLSSAKGHIFSASNKLGANQVQETPVPNTASPLQKFLSLVADGQNQLEETQQHLAALSAKGDQMKPADMLMIQIKLSKAQQELEYSSLLLGKAVDDFKLLMNIQL